MGAAWALDPSIDINTKLESANTALGLNNLWIVIGAVLVIFMQAGLRAGRDRVLPGEARGARGEHELRGLRARASSAFFLIGFPIMFSGFSYPGYFGLDAPLSPDRLIGFGDWTFLWGRSGFALSGVGVQRRRSRRSSSTWSPSWTPPPPSRPARWPSGGSGRRSSAGASSAARSTTRSSVGGPGAAAGSASSATTSTSASATSTSPAPASCTRWVASPRLAGAIVLGAPHRQVRARRQAARAGGAQHPDGACSGTFILLFGWFGFNAASTFAATDLRFTVVAANTAIAAAFGATVAMFYVMKRMGKPDPGMMVNGMLAGLVAITAPCAFVQPWAAAVIGTIAAVIVVEAIFFFERKGIDDPVGAISVHGVGGIFGVLCVGHLLRRPVRRRRGTSPTASTTDGQGRHRHPLRNGEFLGSGSFGKLGFGQLASQAIGALVIIFVMGAHRLRVLQDPERDHEGRHPLRREADEIAGLDRAGDGRARLRQPAAPRARHRRASTRTSSCRAGPSQDPTIGR